MGIVLLAVSTTPPSSITHDNVPTPLSISTYNKKKKYNGNNKNKSK